MKNPVNGVDYLVDHYAILGVDRTASYNEIQKAHRERQKEFNPSRFHNVAPQLFEQATRQTLLINEAWETLGDAEKKTAFDEKLSTWTKPISTNGMAIIDLTSRTFSFSSLVEHLGEDPAAFAIEQEKQALRFSGFDQASFDIISQLAADPNASAQIKEAYAKQLQSRDLYLALLEAFYYKSIGVENPKDLPQLFHVDEIKESVAGVKQLAGATLQEEIFLTLANGGRALLPAPPGADITSDPQGALAHYEARVNDHFATYAARLEELAVERETILEKRFAVEAGLTIRSGVVKYTRSVIVEMKAPSKSLWFCFKLENDHHAKTIQHENLESLSDPAIADQWIAQGYTIISFNVIADIDFKSQLEYILSNYTESMLKEQ